MTLQETQRSAAASVSRRQALATLGLGGAMALGPWSSARAQAAPPVLVELFTSQGCSSCPPADELLGVLAERDDVVALSFNVDYWDYLGWKDSLAQAAFSDRQRAYARSQKQRTVYTPQMVIGGRAAVVGSREDQVEGAIATVRAEPAHADVSLSVDSGEVSVTIRPTSSVPMPCRVLLAAYTRRFEQKIKRGENSGRSIVYHNAVRALTDLGDWAGAAEKTIRKPLVREADGYAAFLQAGEGGPILAAARVDL